MISLMSFRVYPEKTATSSAQSAGTKYPPPGVFWKDAVLSRGICVYGKDLTRLENSINRLL